MTRAELTPFHLYRQKRGNNLAVSFLFCWLFSEARWPAPNSRHFAKKEAALLDAAYRGFFPPPEGGVEPEHIVFAIRRKRLRQIIAGGSNHTPHNGQQSQSKSNGP